MSVSSDAEEKKIIVTMMPATLTAVNVFELKYAMIAKNLDAALRAHMILQLRILRGQ